MPKRVRRLYPLTTITASMLVLAATSGTSVAQVAWKADPEHRAVRMTATEMADAASAAAVRMDAKRLVAQFDAPVTPEQRAALQHAGLTLLSYLGNDAYFVRVDADALDTNALLADRSLTSLRPIDPAWKTHPMVAPDADVEWMRLDVPDDVAGKPLDEEALKQDPVIGLFVVTHADAPTRTEGALAVRKHGGVVRGYLESVNAMVVEMPRSGVQGLASEDAVQWIEPALPGMSELNNSNRLRIGADVVQQAPYDLSGAGVSVMVYDGGRARSTHGDFGGRLFERDNSNPSSHATHVSGTVGGSGAASGGAYRGMAPGVTIQSYGLQQVGGLQQGFLYTDPCDMEEDYGSAINMFDAAAANNSIGTNVAANGYPCDWHGDYGVTDTVIDSIARGSLGRGIPIVFAAGNERGNGRCGTGFGTTAPPANAKNHITVGALNSNNDSMTAFSSWGPSDDGRLKPDVAAPGCQNGPDGAGVDWNGTTSTVSSTTNASDVSYGGSCGTSMAAPTATGAIALILEDFRANNPSAPDPLPSTIKALLMHTAQDVDNFGPDYKTGYGSIRVQPAVEHMRSERYVEGEVLHGGNHSVLVVVDPGQVFKATLVWSDPPGTPNVSPALVNDLDLVVFDPDGVRRYPWTLDPANAGNPAVRTQVDRVNNAEQVYVENATPGVWSVSVVGHNVPQGPQTFSLLADPFLVNCSTVGVARLDRQSYACESEAVVSVSDCDLNTDDDAVETVMALVSSDTNPSGFMLTLTETGPLTALFRATLPLSTTAGAGTLQVAHGDTVLVTYIDADDGMGGTNIVREALATIDCAPPVISDVAVTAINPRDATITFTTDEPAQVSVMYGAACGSLTETLNVGGVRTNHSATLTGLTDGTVYYFSLSAVDGAGNAGSDDNAGVCFTFVTPEIPDFFTELFASGNANDTAFSSVSFIPNGTFEHYSACRDGDIDALPVDPTGGTVLSFVGSTGSPNNLDGFALVTLPPGVEVSLYGVPYERFWVGTNGYITFNSGTTTFTESFANHFSQPRVSALFDDLDLRTQGSCSYLVLSDRVVVTWFNVPEFNAAGSSNTFQIEMRFDGTIVLSWLGLSAADGLAGLSAGGGVPVDFFMSDLSTYGACGQRPPIAQTVQQTTQTNTPAMVTLLATDDGLPKSPGALEYKIVSLPTHGSLADPGSPGFPGSGPIVSVPHTLVGGGNIVQYTPTFNHRGPDAFTFRANDGGTPPEGGDSNLGHALLTVGEREVVHMFDLDADPGWSMEGQWEFGAPLGLGTAGRNDPTSGHTGAHVYGYNNTTGTGHYPNNLTPTQWLTTTAIDCTDLTGTRLEFRRWLGVESSQFDKAYVQASADGLTWTVVWVHAGATVNEAAWSHHSYDISAVADNQPTVYVRWGMGTTDTSVTYHGWNIDDIAIVAFTPLSPCPGDTNGDGYVDFADFSTVLAQYGQSGPGLAGDVNGDGVVDFADFSVVLGAYGTNCLGE